MPPSYTSSDALELWTYEDAVVIRAWFQWGEPEVRRAHRCSSMLDIILITNDRNHIQINLHSKPITSFKWRNLRRFQRGLLGFQL
jgi:uncharacterized protein YaeQ